MIKMNQIHRQIQKEWKRFKDGFFWGFVITAIVIVGALLVYSLFVDKNIDEWHEVYLSCEDKLNACVSAPQVICMNASFNNGSWYCNIDDIIES